MASAWDEEKWARYRDKLRSRAKNLKRDPLVMPIRFDEDDLVSETCLKAHANLAQFQGTTEAQELKWLFTIQDHQLIGMWREQTADKRTPYKEVHEQRMRAGLSSGMFS